MPNDITYSTLISACQKSHQPEHALEIFYVLGQQGMISDVITHSASISACSKDH